MMFSSASPSLPPGLPRNWPRSSDADIEACPTRHVDINALQTFSFCPNLVKTSKYELSNFCPKFLMEEFNPRVKVANVYFLLISGLQCIPAISNTHGYPTTLIPLLIVVFINAVFQVLEDLTRHRADREANTSVTYRLSHQCTIVDHVYRQTGPKSFGSARTISTRDTQHLPETETEVQPSSFEQVLWSELCVGDIVQVNSHDLIPADMVVLCVKENPQSETSQIDNSGPLSSGICYVETKSLDGETNLKVRNALPATRYMSPDAVTASKLKGQVEMEHPNKLIASFSGVISLSNGFNGDCAKGPINHNNILLRGCVLRNTEYIIGLVLNTGSDTKIMMSNAGMKTKCSSLEYSATAQITRIIYVLALVCFVGASGQTIWNSLRNASDIWYLDWDLKPTSNWFVEFFYLFLLHASFLPVSLYVSMSVARYYQSYFMTQDLDMYHEGTDTPAMVRTMTLNEELGQISHIFSDKTGTLTCNNMDFRKFSCGGFSYGLGITEIGKASWKLQGKDIPHSVLEGEAKSQERTVPHVSFYDPAYEELMFDPSASPGGPLPEVRSQQRRHQRKNCLDFFRALAICHDVIIENIHGQLKLSASNPDDEALVCAAGYFGYSFVGREHKFIVLKTGLANSGLNSHHAAETFGNGYNLDNSRSSYAASPVDVVNVNTALHSEDIDDGRLSRDNAFVNDSSTEERVELLETIEFTSKRKRMSVIIRDGEHIRLLTKGADTVIIPRITEEATQTVDKLETTMQHLTAFADEGLRCLLVCTASIPVSVFEDWESRYRAAKADFAEIEKRKRGEVNLIESLEDEIEQNMGWYLTSQTLYITNYFDRTPGSYRH
jgi:phospholipid-translocating P-type ATPase (flippase)